MAKPRLISLNLSKANRGGKPGYNPLMEFIATDLHILQSFQKLQYELEPSQGLLSPRFQVPKKNVRFCVEASSTAFLFVALGHPVADMSCSRSLLNTIVRTLPRMGMNVFTRNHYKWQEAVGGSNSSKERMGVTHCNLLFLRLQRPQHRDCLYVQVHLVTTPQPQQPHSTHTCQPSRLLGTWLHRLAASDTNHWTHH